MRTNRACLFPLILLRLSLFAQPTSAQNSADPSAAVVERDRLFWDAYNGCDVKSMPEFLTEDVEFYHDQGGVMLGAPKVVGTIRDNLCSNPDQGVRREAVKADVAVFLLKDAGAAYGVIITGEHVFYVREKAKPERADGLARFTELWLLRNGAWRMARILSYDHRPISRVEPGADRQ